MVQSQQPYSHMDKTLKKDLLRKLESISPEYGMTELTYSSFIRCCGYRSQPLSAADCVEALTALLDAATGVKLEIEVEGARNGGEWFGGGKTWHVKSERERNRWKDDERENIPPKGDLFMKRAADGETGAGANGEAQGTTEGSKPKGKQQLNWWMKNFWSAYDALNE